MPPTGGTNGIPGNSELMRGIERVEGRLQQLAIDLAKDYVRKEVQDERERLNALQINGVEVEVHSLGDRITKLTDQRDAERDERDKQRAADRRLIWTILVTALLGPIVVALILHGLGAT